MRRRRTTTNAAIAAVAITSPAMPMNTVDTTPSAAMAPRAPRIGPMQQATQATAAKPRISRRLMPPSRTDRRRCRRPPRAWDLQRGAAVVDGDGEGEELTAALFGAHETAEVADVDAGVELDPQAAVRGGAARRASIHTRSQSASRSGIAPGSSVQTSESLERFGAEHHRRRSSWSGGRGDTGAVVAARPVDRFATEPLGRRQQLDSERAQLDLVGVGQYRSWR